MGFQFYWFWGCGLGKFTLIVTCVFYVFFYFAALARLCDIVLRENFNIFVVSLVVTYLTYLSWTALASQPGETCNPFHLSGVNTFM
jgi:hypothetical protein